MKNLPASGASVLKPVYEYIANNRRLIILCAFLIFGFILGCSAANMKDSVIDISSLFDNFITARNGESFFAVLFSSFLSSLLYLACAYLSGLFCFGAAGCLLIPLFRGLGLGVITGYAYCAYGLSGAAFSMLIIIPHAFFSSIVLLFSCREAFGFSLKIFSQITKNPHVYDLNSEFKRYTLKFVLFIILMLLSSVLDSVMSCVFFGVFSFTGAA